MLNWHCVVYRLAGIFYILVETFEIKKVVKIFIQAAQFNKIFTRFKFWAKEDKYFQRLFCIKLARSTAQNFFSYLHNALA
jgi:hypothetical protein